MENRFVPLLAGSKKKGSSGSASSSKKIAIYAVIGILAVAAASVALLPRGDNLTLFQKQFCGINARANSNGYVSELVLPSECEMPLGIAVDTERVWYVSTKQGTIGSYNLSEKKFEKEHAIPSWPARSQPAGSSMSWAAKVDGNGDVWFTDEKQNTIWRFNRSSETFDMFNVPARYPASLDFDKNGNIYFTGIFSRSLYFGDVTRMKSGTSDGISEIALPLEAFEGVDQSRINTGSLVVDGKKNAVWMSMLAIEVKGQIYRYDIDANKVETFDLPPELASPVGAVLDDAGNLWVTDHGTSIFFRLDPTTKTVAKFVTSTASPKIFGGTSPPNAYTLPYWIQKGPDGALWFNEHTGNKIARFDPEELTLIEYWIPSQNSQGFVCPPDAKTCGLANALQFSIGQDNQVWFTEWTENKIGMVDTEKEVPFSVTAEEELTVAKGDSAEIKVTVSASENFSGKMMAAGTLTRTGELGSSTGIFSEGSVSISASDSKQVSYTFTPAEDLEAGQYIIMVGAGNDEVSYLKAVMINVV